jgi:hypothetical protein
MEGKRYCIYASRGTFSVELVRINVDLGLHREGGFMTLLVVIW